MAEKYSTHLYRRSLHVPIVVHFLLVVVPIEDFYEMIYKSSLFNLRLQISATASAYGFRPTK